MFTFPCIFRLVDDPKQFLVIFPDSPWHSTHDAEKPRACAYQWMYNDGYIKADGRKQRVFSSLAEFEHFIMEPAEQWWARAQLNVMWEKV